MPDAAMIEYQDAPEQQAIDAEDVTMADAFDSHASASASAPPSVPANRGKARQT